MISRTKASTQLDSRAEQVSGTGGTPLEPPMINALKIKSPFTSIYTASETGRHNSQLGLIPYNILTKPNQSPENFLIFLLTNQLELCY